MTASVFMRSCELSDRAFWAFRPEPAALAIHRAPLSFLPASLRSKISRSIPGPIRLALSRANFAEFSSRSCNVCFCFLRLRLPIRMLGIPSWGPVCRLLQPVLLVFRIFKSRDLT